MTKHPAQASKTPPRTAPHPDRAPELHQGDSRPPNRPWRVRRHPTTGNWWATYTPCTSPDDLTCPCDHYPTWQEAIAYVNRQIRAERWAKAAHEVANAGIPARFFTHGKAGQ